MVIIWVSILLGLDIHKHQDQIQESSSQVTQPIKDVTGEDIQDTGASTPYVYLNIMKPKVEPASEEYRQNFMN